MSEVNTNAFSYFKHAKAMTAFISDLPGNPNIAELVEEVSENQMGFRMRSAKTGRVETMIYIATLTGTNNGREMPEVEGWTFRPRNRNLQEHLNLVTIYND